MPGERLTFAQAAQDLRRLGLSSKPLARAYILPRVAVVIAEAERLRGERDHAIFHTQVILGVLQTALGQLDAKLHDYIEAMQSPP